MYQFKSYSGASSFWFSNDPPMYKLVLVSRCGRIMHVWTIAQPGKSRLIVLVFLHHSSRDCTSECPFQVHRDAIIATSIFSKCALCIKGQRSQYCNMIFSSISVEEWECCVIVNSEIDLFSQHNSWLVRIGIVRAFHCLL